MDIDDDTTQYVDMRPYGSLEKAVAGACRSTQLPSHQERSSSMRRLRCRPLGTIDEAAETAMTRSSESRSEPEEVSGAVVEPETEIPAAENVYELPADVNDDEDDGGSQASEPAELFQTESVTDVSVRQRCTGWRFSSTRPRLAVAEFCRRRRDAESKKRQRPASMADDSVVSVTDSLGPSAKRRRTSFKVVCQIPSKRRTNGRTKRRVSVHLSVRPSVRSFVCFFVRCVCQGRPSYGGTNRDAS